MSCECTGVSLLQGSQGPDRAEALVHPDNRGKGLQLGKGMGPVCCLRFCPVALT
jgi:hypothetical protein